MDKREIVRSRICEILAMSKDEVADDVSFVNLGVESFTLINMAIDLQETFKVRLNQEDLTGVHKMGELISLIASRMK